MQELIIFKRAYDLCKWLFGHTSKFPKNSRFSVAVKLENGILEFIRFITIANHRQKKMPLLQSADEALIMLKIYIRLSHDLQFINTTSYEYAIGQMEELGKMLGGWMKSQQERASSIA